MGTPGRDPHEMRQAGQLVGAPPAEDPAWRARTGTEEQVDIAPTLDAQVLEGVDRVGVAEALDLRAGS